MKHRMVHVNWNVSDLEASMAFYEKALGLTEKRRKTADDGSFILVYLTDGTSDFELELTWLAEHPQKVILSRAEKFLFQGKSQLFDVEILSFLPIGGDYCNMVLFFQKHIIPPGRSWGTDFGPCGG